MELITVIAGNLVSSFFLWIVIHIARRRLDRHDKFNKLFLGTGYLVSVALLLEALVRVLDGKPSMCADCILKLLYAFLFSLPAPLAYFWMLFSKVLTGDDSETVGLIRPVYLIPASITGLLSFLSVFFGLVFSIDADNAYRRGPLFGVVMGITLGYLLMGLHILCKRRKRLSNEEFRMLALICMLPTVGGILQVVFANTFFMWSMTADALIVLYLFLQERMIQVDGLTGVWTRRSFSQHLDQMSGKCRERPLGILFLDIDDFKSINDKYGHAAGDEALKTFSDIVKAQLRKDDVLARLGGDEFAILAEVSGEDGLRAIENKIAAALEKYNAGGKKPYRLRCSVGSELYEASCGIDAALSDVDRLMYEQKRKKKGE